MASGPVTLVPLSEHKTHPRPPGDSHRRQGFTGKQPGNSESSGSLSTEFGMPSNYVLNGAVVFPSPLRVFAGLDSWLWKLGGFSIFMDEPGLLKKSILISAIRGE